MCCGRRAEYGNYAAGHSNTNSNTDIAQIITALRDLKMAFHGVDSRTQAAQQQVRAPARFDPGIERGIAHADTIPELPTPTDEKMPFAEESMLPTYEEVTKPDQDAARAMPMIEPDFKYDPETQASRGQRVRGLDSLENFRTALLAYRRGVDKSKHNVRSAAKSYVRSLFDQELARRQQQDGRCCGQRCEVKRELRPIKALMKDAIWEAKQERKMRF